MRNLVSILLRYLLLALPLLTLIPHPSQIGRGHEVTLAVLVVLAAAGLIARLFSHVPRIPLWFAGGLALYAFGHLIGWTQSIAPITGAYFLTHHLLAVALAILYADAIRDPEFRQKLPAVLMLVLVVQSLAGWWDLLTNGTDTPSDGLLNHGNVWAFTLAAWLPWIVFTPEESGYPRWLKVTIACVVILSLPLSRSLGVVVALLAAIVIWAASRERAIPLPKFLIPVFALIILGAGIWLATADSEVAYNDRTHLMIGGWNVWQDHLVLGIGPGQYPYYGVEQRVLDDTQWPALTMDIPKAHVHLEPLQTLLEGGVVAAIGLVLLVFGGMISLFRSRHGPANQVVTAAMLSLAIVSLHGIVTLAPSREGVLPAAMAIGFAAGLTGYNSDSRPLEGSVSRVPIVLLAILLISPIPIQSRRLKVDGLIERFNMQSQQMRVENLQEVRKGLELWPESLFIRGLLIQNLHLRAYEAEGELRTEILYELLDQGHIMKRYAWQYYRVPILVAYAWEELGYPERALIIINSTNRFDALEDVQNLRDRLKQNIRNQ